MLTFTNGGYVISQCMPNEGIPHLQSDIFSKGIIEERCL